VFEATVTELPAVDEAELPPSEVGTRIPHSELRSELLKALLRARRPGGDKDAVRSAHVFQRRDRALAEKNWFQSRGWKAVASLAESSEVDPSAIAPRLIPIHKDGRDADLFRLACLFWSVPVSRGYGRRMRFLVVDESNDKLIGIVALGDPVFNLRARDAWVGWSSADRAERISSMMDLYVCGAVPPYTDLLCGKLVAALATSSDVVDLFESKYRGRQGHISGREKPSRLLAVTTTSALGRSSLYNRLRLQTNPVTDFSRLGMTGGWGHFAVGDELFLQLRELLEANDHAYANGHKFGTGPNWRLRTIRAAMDLLELDDGLLNHGIQREVFGAELAIDGLEQLRAGFSSNAPNRPTSLEVSNAALKRWIQPRYERSGIRTWTRADSFNQITTGGTVGTANDLTGT
jgi:hypothetical protein